MRNLDIMCGWNQDTVARNTLFGFLNNVEERNQVTPAGGWPRYCYDYICKDMNNQITIIIIKQGRASTLRLRTFCSQCPTSVWSGHYWADIMQPHPILVSLLTTRHWMTVFLSAGRLWGLVHHTLQSVLQQLTGFTRWTSWPVSWCPSGRLAPASAARWMNFSWLTWPSYEPKSARPRSTFLLL